LSYRRYRKYIFFYPNSQDVIILKWTKNRE